MPNALKTRRTRILILLPIILALLAVTVPIDTGSGVVFAGDPCDPDDCEWNASYACITPDEIKVDYECDEIPPM